MVKKIIGVIAIGVGIFIAVSIASTFFNGYAQYVSNTADYIAGLFTLILVEIAPLCLIASGWFLLKG
jgi:hypothetical protein